MLLAFYQLSCELDILKVIRNTIVFLVCNSVNHTFAIKVTFTNPKNWESHNNTSCEVGI